MSASARLLARAVCAMVLSACADSTDPVAPRAEESHALPALSVAPTPDELAEMPPEFATAPSIQVYSTDVNFEPQKARVSAFAYMSYLATDASQDLTLSLRFENDQIASTEAHGEQSDWFPAFRALVTTASLGVSGSCGHLADANANHRAWHEFLVGGWKYLSWGNQGRSSGNSTEQPACPPPPPEPPSGGGGGGDEYEGGCELCQEWLYFSDGQLLDVWWECQPIDDYWCDGLMR